MRGSKLAELVGKTTITTAQKSLNTKAGDFAARVEAQTKQQEIGILKARISNRVDYAIEAENRIFNIFENACEAGLVSQNAELAAIAEVVKSEVREKLEPLKAGKLRFSLAVDAVAAVLYGEERETFQERGNKFRNTVNDLLNKEPVKKLLKDEYDYAGDWDYTDRTPAYKSVEQLVNHWHKQHHTEHAELSEQLAQKQQVINSVKARD